MRLVLIFLKASWWEEKQPFRLFKTSSALHALRKNEQVPQKPKGAGKASSTTNADADADADVDATWEQQKFYGNNTVSYKFLYSGFYNWTLLFVYSVKKCLCSRLGRFKSHYFIKRNLYFNASVSSFIIKNKSHVHEAEDYKTQTQVINDILMLSPEN